MIGAAAIIGLGAIAGYQYSRDHQPLRMADVENYCGSTYPNDDPTAQAECGYRYVAKRLIANHYGADPEGIAPSGFRGLNENLALATQSQLETLQNLEDQGDHFKVLELETRLMISRFNEELPR